MYVERLAERLGITAPTVSFHLKKLADAGAVTSYKSQYYTMYSLNKDIFETSMLDIIREKSDEADAQAQRDAVYRQKVIDAFFEQENPNVLDCYEKRKLWAGLLHHIHYVPKNSAAADFVQAMRGKGENKSVYAAFTTGVSSFSGT